MRAMAILAKDLGSTKSSVTPLPGATTGNALSIHVTVSVALI